MPDNVVGKPSYFADVPIQVIWIHIDPFEELEHSLMQGSADKRVCIIHDGEEVSSRNVPYSRVDPSFSSRPRDVKFMLDASGSLRCIPPWVVY